MRTKTKGFSVNIRIRIRREVLLDFLTIDPTLDSITMFSMRMLYLKTIMGSLIRLKETTGLI
jgi:hypothetical protein